MHTFFEISGVVGWVCLGVIGLAVITDWLVDFLVNSLWTKREFLAFVWDRLKRSRQAASGPTE